MMQKDASQEAPTVLRAQDLSGSLLDVKRRLAVPVFILN